MSNPFAWAGRIPRPVIFLLAILCLAIPQFVPLSLPVGVTPFVREIWETTDALQDGGGNVLFLFSISPGFWQEMSGQIYALIQHYMAVPNLNFVIVPLSTTSPSLLERVLDGVGIGDPISNPLNKVYGEDWVIMDYVPGSSQVQITMLSSDLRGRLDEDELGTPIDDLPIFDDINSIADFDIVVFQMGPRSSPDVAVYMYPNYPTEQPGNPVYYICGIGEGFALVTPWVGPGLPYPAGMFGPVNAAEYMSLTRDYYDIPLQSIGLRLVDGLSLFHLLAIILMILGNLVVVGDKLGGKK